MSSALPVLPAPLGDRRFRRYRQAAPAAAPASDPPFFVEQLCADILLYLERTGMAKSAFGYAVARNYNLVDRLRGSSPRPATVARIRDFMAAQPDGVGRKPPAASAAPDPPPCKSSVAAEVAHEAEISVARRGQARRLTGRYPLDIQPLSLFERIQTGLVETPHDLIAAINRKHPQLVARAVRLGRACGTTPAAALYDALDRGLSAIEIAGAPGLDQIEARVVGA